MKQEKSKRSSSPIGKLNLYKTIFKSQDAGKEKQQNEHHKKHGKDSNNTQIHGAGFVDDQILSQHQEAVVSNRREKYHPAPAISSKSLYDMSKPRSTKSSPEVKQVIRHSSSNMTSQTQKSE